jgi:tRNA (guanine-N7-)-methyltransferase
MTDYRRVASRIFISHDKQTRPMDWLTEFQTPRPIQVEIGFGQGEYVLSCARQDPGKNYIGIELDWARIRTCFKKAALLPDDARRIVEDQVRLLHIDAWVILERMFRQKTIAQVVSLFPCPWPKERHERHRLFSQKFLRLVNSRLEDSGSLRCVTDHRRYADWILEQAADTGFRVSESAVPAQFGTNFERKWISGGQKVFYEIRFQKERHITIPLKEDVELKAFYHQEFNPEVFDVQQEINEETAIVPKEWMFDPLREKGEVRLIVSEEHLTQHLRVVIIKTRKGWCVLRAEGQNILPTPGIARAIELVSESAALTTASDKALPGPGSFE